MDYRTILLAKVLGSEGSKFRSVQAELETLYTDGDNLYNMLIKLPVRDMVAQNDMGTVYFPSQSLIKKHDPDGTKSVAEMHILLLDSFKEFRKCVMSGFGDGDGSLSIEEALDIY
jgi:hypothetical protein